MSQTTYSRERAKAVPGLISKDAQYFVVSYPAGEAITPGREVELQSDGTVKHPQATSRTKPVGVAAFSPTNQQTAIPAAGFTYAVGDMVPVLRKGRIYASYQGGTPAALTPAKVNHSSTTATHRGKFSASDASGVAGSEISPAGSAVFVEAGPSGVWLMELDYMGQANANPLTPTPLSLPAFAAGDSAPASIQHMGVYDVPATAANSTISLPAAAPDGTVCFIHADGTKNGHTLTVRDVTTVISAAATASKRVAITAMKADGKWVCTMTVGP